MVALQLLEQVLQFSIRFRDGVDTEIGDKVDGEHWCFSLLSTGQA
jgi:hypothetical protein